MSDFDKYVAQWVSRAGDNLSKEARERLLSNIHESLDDYEALRDPAAARAKKEAAEAAKRREEEQKQREEQNRRRQERQANLPPLPPPSSASKAATPTTAAEPATAAPADATVSAEAGKPKKRKVSGRKSTTAAAGKASKGTKAESATDDAKPKPSGRVSRRPAGSVQVRDIDFGFVERVDAQLQELEQEAATRPAPPPRAAAAATTTTSATASQGTRPAASSRTKRTVRMAPVATTVEAAPAHADPTPEPEAVPAAPVAEARVARKRSSPPPLDQVAAEDEERENGAPAAALPGNGAVDHDDDDDSVPSLSETGNYQEQLNGFHFASVGDDPRGNDDDDDRSDVVDDEEEFIDDREDVRRRTLQMQRPSRPAISDSTLDIDEARIANFPTTPKSQNKVKTISRVLVRHFLFSTLDDSDIARFASIMDIENYAAGEHLLTKGESNDTFYIILDGEAEMVEAGEDGEESVVPLVRGSTCGDVALMYEVRNDTDVVARSQVQCATLERRTYKMITSRAMEEKRRRYNDFLASIPIFEGLSPYEIERVAETLKEDTYVEGQKVIAYGVPNHWLHFVMEGTLRVLMPGVDGDEEKEVHQAHSGQYVGEIEFIYHHLPVASVFAASPVVKTAKLSRRSFELVPSGVRERLIRAVEEDPSYAPYHARMHSASPPAYDKTPHFDAPPASVQRSMQSHGSDRSESASGATRTPTPPPLNS